MGVKPAFVYVCVCLFTLSNMNICGINRPVAIKFYQKHHWSGGKAALSFGPDRIRTLVSIATDSSHRVIMEKTVLPLFLLFFIRSFAYLQVTMTCMRVQMSLKFGQFRPPSAELAALEH